MNDQGHPRPARHPMLVQNHLVNPVVRTLLRARVHGLLSGAVALITVTGRRTGRAYSTPVMYPRDGHDLYTYVGSPERKTTAPHYEDAPPGCSLTPGCTSEYAAAMSAWKAIEQTEPEFAGRVRRLFDAGRHKTIATLRADGSPRVSGIECEFTDGDLRFGSMTGARKGADLQRDPRFALHGPAFHPEEGKERDWPGEAKIAGRAIPAGPVATDEADEQPDGQMFVADITEVVITGLNAEATKLVVESWTPERGLRRVERD